MRLFSFEKLGGYKKYKRFHKIIVNYDYIKGPFCFLGIIEQTKEQSSE
jgi:hypothetical protein